VGFSLTEALKGLCVVCEIRLPARLAALDRANQPPIVLEVTPSVFERSTVRIRLNPAQNLSATRVGEAGSFRIRFSFELDEVHRSRCELLPCRLTDGR
jgi:hypothetical protein